MPGTARTSPGRRVAGGADAICVLGGDGTVNEVINGIAESGVPLLIAPTGTVNVLALELGMPWSRPMPSGSPATAASRGSTSGWPASATSPSWPASGSTPWSSTR